MNRGFSKLLHILSTAVLMIVAMGFWLRKRWNALHIRLMISAFLIDLGLVLYIEFSRHAVQKVVASTRPLVWFHAAVSVAVLATYVVMIQLGRGLLAGKPMARRWHRVFGTTFVVLRGLNYVTSYLVT